jgi:hypothetical protein
MTGASAYIKIKFDVSPYGVTTSKKFLLSSFFFDMVCIF